MESLPKVRVLEHKLWCKARREVDSWSIGSLLCVLCCFPSADEHRQAILSNNVTVLQTTCSNPFLVVFILFCLFLLFLPSLPSSLSLPLPAPSLPPLCTTIYLISSIRSILKAKVKPKSGWEPRHHFLKWQALVIGRFAIIQIIASTWCKVNQATVREQKVFQKGSEQCLSIHWTVLVLASLFCSSVEASP